METSEGDIYMTAKLLINQYGDDSTFQASTKVDALLEAGELDGQSMVAHSQRDKGHPEYDSTRPNELNPAVP
jgi:hypothetical protein